MSRYTARINPIGEIPFIDGIIRPVYLDADGPQYVLDDDGQPVYGVWIHVDEPQIVEAFTLDKTKKAPASRWR